MPSIHITPVPYGWNRGWYRPQGLGQAVDPITGGELGAPPGAVCLDRNEQVISCLDPECYLGDCGYTGYQQMTGALCLGPTVNGVETQIACNDPMCTYGDCIPTPSVPKPPGTTPGTTPVPGASPRPAPVIQTNIQTGGGVQAPQSRDPLTLWMNQPSTLILGWTNMGVMGLGLAAVVVLGAVGGGGYYAGRRR